MSTELVISVSRHVCPSEADTNMIRTCLSIGYRYKHDQTLQMKDSAATESEFVYTMRQFREDVG